MPRKGRTRGKRRQKARRRTRRVYRKTPYPRTPAPTQAPYPAQARPTVMDNVKMGAAVGFGAEAGVMAMDGLVDGVRDIF